MSGCSEKGCKGRMREQEPLPLSPALALEAGFGSLPPRPRGGGRLHNLLFPPPTPQPFSPEGRGRRTRRPFLPGWARVPARRRSLPRRVPPASAQRGAPAPVASSSPSPPPRSLPPPLFPSLPAPRLHARPPPPPPRGERRPPSLVPGALLAAAARAGTAVGPSLAERTHPGTRTRPTGAPPRTPDAAPPGARVGQMRCRAPLAPGPPPRSAARRGLLSRAPLGALLLWFPPAPWNNP